MPKKKGKKNEDFDSDQDEQVSVESKGKSKGARGNPETNEKVTSKSGKKKKGKNSMRYATCF